MNLDEFEFGSDIDVEDSPRASRGFVFDVETGAGDRWGDPEWCANFRSRLRPRGNLRDELKIAADIDEKFEAARSKAALSPLFGRVRAIGAAELVGGAPRVRIFANDREDERAILLAFFEWVRDLATDPRDVLVGGFNIRRFDVPFVSVRAAMLGIAPPRAWPHPKDWRRILDPMDLDLSGESALRHWLDSFGIPQKLETGEHDNPSTMPLAELLPYLDRDVSSEHALVMNLLPYLSRS